MLGCVCLNINKKEVLNWDSFQSVIKSFKSEFPDCARGDDDRMRFTIAPNRFLDIVEVPAEGVLKDHINKRLSNTACLFLAKDDSSEFMFAKREMSASGVYKPKRYIFSKAKLLNSDIARLRKLRCRDESSFDSLFDTRGVVKRFYGEYKVWLERLGKNIKGIRSDTDRRHYSQILLSRMMFLYFIQTKNFLSENPDYLARRLAETKRNGGNFYRDFLLVLFFKVLNTRKKNRPITGFGAIPFLNGGLFKEHDLEKAHDIQIDNDILGGVLKFLDGWMWYVDETADYEGGVQSINPEIMGHIFEKNITDQSKKGAYYTPIDVTEYICNETIIPYCIRQVNERFSCKYEKLPEILKSAEHTKYLYFDVLKKISILDPSCGSGEFILTASKILFDLYMNAWKTIENLESPQVKQEQFIIAGRLEYYFKRRIVTENLYGVDTENGALEICKLRLWLSLVSAMSKDKADPLPNIDYNIMQGNSLVGYIDIPEKQQYSIDNPYGVEEILRKVDRLKDRYNKETDPQVAELLREGIQQEIKPCNDMLNRARASDIVVCKERRPTANHMQKINPFHWRLHFHEAVTAGGFDIIVGNPPYGAKTDYPTSFLRTWKTGNTYAYFVEVSMGLLKSSGRLGYIIPVSSISTTNMASLQETMLDGFSELKISNYDDRPGKLFEGLQHCRSSIILGTKHDSGLEEKTCAVSTTRYHRWASANRQDLFTKIRPIPVNLSGLLECTRNGIPMVLSKMNTIPKFGDEIEKGILAKIYQKPSLVQATYKKPGFSVYYHNAPQYWIRAMNVPTFRKTIKVSSHVKFVYLKNKKAAIVALALLNSSLFYWFFIKTSNCRDLTVREIENIPIGVDEFASTDVLEFTTLTQELMKNYKNNSEIKTDNRTTGTLRYEAVYPMHAKPIIDRIDDILAVHFGFTRKEAVYIKSFDEEFRMRDN